MIEKIFLIFLYIIVLFVCTYIIIKELLKGEVR